MNTDKHIPDIKRNAFFALFWKRQTLIGKQRQFNSRAQTPQRKIDAIQFRLNAIVLKD